MNMPNELILLILLFAALLAGLVVWIKNRPEFEFQIEDVVLSTEDLERHAENLAKSQKTKKDSAGVRRVRQRLERNYKVILDAYSSLNQDAAGAFPIPPAAEWLLDNFYIIEEQRSIITRELNDVRSSLPVINEGAYRGYPRIFAIAVEIVSHIDGNANEKVIKDFIRAYQKYSFLSIEELWMLTLMIKVALMEKLWIVCTKMQSTRHDWYRAEQIANTVKNGDKSCENFKEYIHEADQLTPAFVEHLIKRLRKEGSKTLWMIDCLDGILVQQSTTTDALISIDHYNQATHQVSMGNVINSMRTLSSFDNTILFEELSEVERILKLDPSGVYPAMDFNSRNYYRTVITKLARKYKTTEINIARLSCDIARESYKNDPELSPNNHVGFYLVDKGRDTLASILGKNETGIPNNAKFIGKNSVKLYLLTIVGLTVIIALLPMIFRQGRAYNLGLAVLIPVFIVSLIPASEIALSIIHSCISRLVLPARFPKLELKEGIPVELSTMVIVPTLVPNIPRTLALIDNLEVFYLANREKNLYFCLVGDFKDADQEKLADDEGIVAAALRRIDELNKKYCKDMTPVFYFYCRERRYNEKQGKWMGWERKRGAIIEFNRLLRGNANTSYTFKSTDPKSLPHIKYVITLDADTQLPLETAKQLTGCIAHPLNRAVFDTGRGIVTKGYGLLQPRINVNIESANVSLFTKVFAGQGGIDPYTTTVSDVYQDAFGEGIFTGKGIYDVDIFLRSLENTIPENAVLSHDLLEGSFLRAGLVTDIELIDGYPAKYNSYMMRLHRWTRGDWQLLPWIFGRNSLPALSRWKMIDNLRRSLLYPAMVLLLLLCLAVPGREETSMLWLLLVALCTPVINYLIHILIADDYRIYISKRSATVITGFKAIMLQLGLIFVFAPYQAYLLLHAAIKTIIRVAFTKKNLLEWVTAADMELALKNDLSCYYRRMWFSPALGALALLLSLNYSRQYFGFVIPSLIAWALAPWLAYHISKPYGNTIRLSGDSLEELRLLARKTWCYFDEFAGKEDNFLPADNYQVEPFKGAAHRTSPTNIGMLLASNLGARDLGYIGTTSLMDRIGNTLDTIDKLPKWHGHLLNWYNTSNLEVLRPRFVSTVDSGNFAGYLMVLKEGLEDYRNKPVYDEKVLIGLFDLLRLCNQEIGTDREYFDIELLQKLTDSEALENVLSNVLTEISNHFEQLDVRQKQGYWLKKLAEFLQVAHEDYEKYGESLYKSVKQNAELNGRIVALKDRIQSMLDAMEFGRLFDKERNLFAIGFDLEEGHLSKSYYDLFASEARQTSLIAIARGEVTKQHWFKLGRKLVRANGEKGLASWTGTMFEYLMPRLIIKSYPSTLIAKTYQFVVNTQIKYGLDRDIPWGISESGFYAFDIALNYQYKAFGVPQLGLKRGLANDCVVSPYSTVMALELAPEECVKNYRKFREIGAEGKFGLYEAIDFSDSRLGEKEKYAIVKSYMVHHQGMSMLAFVNFFSQNIMQTRFHRYPEIKAVDALIQEKFPANVVISKEYRDKPSYGKRRQSNSDEMVIRELDTLSVYPKMHLLSNGSYYAMLTDKGSGYGRIGGLAVYRWVNDYMQSSGAFVYVRNVNSNEYWSTTFNPVNTIPEAYKVVFAPHKAEYVRREGNIETNMEVLISSEDNTELRKITIHNHSNSRRTIELTSYMEAVLAPPESDQAHPAFSKLFVKTEYVEKYHGLLAVRRQREANRQNVWGYHIVSTEGAIQGQIEYETDRSKFIGRNRTLSDPKAMEPDQPLSNSVGPVLDPIFALRIRVCIEAGKSAVVNFCTGSCESKGIAYELLEKYGEPTAADRVIEMAWTRSLVEAGFINADTKEEEAYLKLLPKIVYGLERKDQSEYIAQNKLGQSDLWPFGISGDIPIVLVTVESRDSFEEIQWVLKLHDYYRLKGIIFDLVFLLVDEESYTQPLFDMIRDMAVSGHAGEHLDRRGGIFIRNARQMEPEQVNLLFASARFVIHADHGIAELMESVEKVLDIKVQEDKAVKRKPFQTKKVEYCGSEDGRQNEMETSRLQFFNGLGGFSQNSEEYIICLRDGRSTPAPWVNVIANEKFGFICTESGGGYTWHMNSSQNKLTTWINDPITDIPSEAIYIHDVQSGELWNCAPSPIREMEMYTIRHGFGYTLFHHISHGLEQDLVQFAAVNEPVKISIVKLKNLTGQQKEINLAYFLKPVLGTDYGQTLPYIVTSYDRKLSTVFIENVYNSDFRGQMAFLSCSENNITYTGDRLEFVGGGLDMSRPSGMERVLRGSVGAGLDACAVNKTGFSLKPGEVREVVFLFGQDTLEAARAHIHRFRKISEATAELDRVKESWSQKLRQIQVNTPDASMNILLNGWLQYQVLSCRVWARSGYYQAGGAFGFRDQLQDVMSVVYSSPEITKNQILLHCRHQFVEGDVQHWWHDQKTNGIRTRYSDDLLWLPYVACDYINATGDYDILNAREPYLESPVLRDDEHERYEIPSVSAVSETVYQHCNRAIERGLRFGEHGIPLMGGGDWNDGMNLVGVNGKGESVWLGWFLYSVLQRMIPICRHRGDAQKAEEYQQYSIRMIQAIEDQAWDGSWYRRAYFDDGSPLGSISNEEGKIDSLSQSWAAITGAARQSRVQEGMDAIDKYLIDRKNGLIKLLTPPFYDCRLDPGYIKGYLPGVRENGGQYTHAATWVIYAFSRLGNGDMAWELFNMINPINHSRTNMECMTYKVEPYVMAADVYAVYPNEGRGGWTWYTGAAGWMYRIGIESLLGLKKQGDFLRIEPCIPRNIEKYSITYKYGRSNYNILVFNQRNRAGGVKQITLDQNTLADGRIPLVDDGKTYQVEVFI